MARYEMFLCDMILFEFIAKSPRSKGEIWEPAAYFEKWTPEYQAAFDERRKEKSDG